MGQVLSQDSVMDQIYAFLGSLWLYCRGWEGQRQRDQEEAGKGIWLRDAEAVTR